jgi:hypothetical protein
MFEIAMLVTMPFIGLTLNIIGNKNYIIAGYVIVVGGTIGYGLLTNVPPQNG